MKEKKDLSYLYAGLGAVAFFVAGVPILDAVGGWVSNIFGLKSVKLNAEASEIVGEDENKCECTHAIGFQVPSEEVGEMEDE